MIHYQSIRIDLIHDDVLPFFQEFLKQYDDIILKGFIVLEEGKITGKKHIQGLLELSEESALKDMRNYIVRKILKNKGTKGDYSFCAVRKSETDYMIYLCKGGEGCIQLNEFVEGTPLQVIFQKGYTDEDIDSYRNSALEKQEKYLKTKQKNKSIGQILLEYIKSKEDVFLLDELPSYNSPLGAEYSVNPRLYAKCKCGKYLDKKTLVKLIIRFFSEETKKFRSFLIEEFYNLVEHHYSPQTTEERICKDLEERLCYKYVY